MLLIVLSFIFLVITRPDPSFLVDILYWLHNTDCSAAQVSSRYKMLAENKWRSDWLATVLLATELTCCKWNTAFSCCAQLPSQAAMWPRPVWVCVCICVVLLSCGQFLLCGKGREAVALLRLEARLQLQKHSVGLSIIFICNLINPRLAVN